MPSFTLSRRNGFIAALFIVTGIAAYIFYWNSLAHALDQRFSVWEQEETKTGATLKAERRMKGFPFGVILELSDFSYDRPDFVKVVVPHIDLAINPLTPFRLTAVAEKGGQSHFYKMNYDLSAQNAVISLARPLFRARSVKNNGLFASLTLNGVGLDERQKLAMGNFVQTISFRAKVKGAAPDPMIKREVEAWRNAGGTIELDHIALVWGSVTLNGKGTLALDRDFQPQAAFSTTIMGHEQAVDVMRDQGQLKPLMASVIKAAFKMLEEEDKDKSTPQSISVPITIQNNALAIAGVIITNWDPYPWQN